MKICLDIHCYKERLIKEFLDIPSDYNSVIELGPDADIVRSNPSLSKRKKD